MGKWNSGNASAIPRQVLENGEIEAFERGKDELNLAEFPIAVVAESARPGQLTLVFSDSIQDRSTGKTVERSVTVHGTEEWGLPAAQDDDVMIGLLQLCFLHGWPKRIRFTRYQLCKLLRWSVGGASYRRIYQALHRLSTTTYNYRYGWRDRENQQWIPSLVFSYIQGLKIHKADSPTESGLCEVTWSDDFHRSLRAGSLKGLDFHLFIGLRSAIAKRLYRFLDKRFGAGRSRYSCDLKVLAFEKIGVSRSYQDAAQIKRLLMPAIRELEKAKFLQPLPPEKRFERIYRGQWRAHFEVARKSRKVTPIEPSKEPMEQKLIQLGIVPSEATKFVRDFPEAYLAEKIDQFPFRHPKQNPAGLLADSIRRNLPAPSGYVTPQDRAREAARKKRQEERRSAEAERRKREEASRDAAEQALHRKAKAALESLSRTEREKLESEVRRQFSTAGKDLIRWTMLARLRDQIVSEASSRSENRTGIRESSLEDSGASKR